MGTPSGFENRDTLMGVGSSSLPLSAKKCKHDRDDDFCKDCYIELLDEISCIALVRGFKPSVLETAIRQEHMKVFMATKR